VTGNALPDLIGSHLYSSDQVEGAKLVVAENVGMLACPPKLGPRQPCAGTEQRSNLRVFGARLATICAGRDAGPLPESVIERRLR
jgi:hypothetical protein